MENVKLEYTLDDGTTWTEIVASTPASTGTYDWVITEVPSRSYRIRISDADTINVSDVSLDTFTIYPAEKGDVNGNGLVDLNDLIMVLQALTGREPSSPIFRETDINDDGKLVVEDSIYIIQRIAGFR